MSDPISSPMNRLRGARPVSDDSVASIAALEGVSNSVAQLRDEIQSDPRPNQAPRRSDRRRMRFAAAAVAFVAVGVLVFGGISKLTGGEREASAWAAADVAFALRTPQALLTDPAWRLTRVDQYGEANDSGELNYVTRGTKTAAGIFWVPSKYHRGYVRDRANKAKSIHGVKVEGDRANIYYSYAGDVGGPDWTAYSALWLHNNHGMRFETAFRGSPTKKQNRQFLALLSSVRTVSTDSWLGAMPKNVLLPAALPGATRKILNQIPTPTGFTTDVELKNLNVSTRPALATRIIAGVECAWIRSWVDARHRGDKATMAYVVKNVSGYKTWPYNKPQKLPNGGSWAIGTSFIESLSHGGAMDAGRGKTRDINSRMPGSGVVGAGKPLYAGSLGCQSAY